MVPDSRGHAPTFLPARYLLAVVVLFAALIGLYAFLEARQAQRDLGREMHDRALALLDALEASSRNAIGASGLLEELVGQRLLDNARLVDEAIARGAYDQRLADALVAQNGLRKVELLDRQGKPLPLADLPQAVRLRRRAWA